MTKREQVIASPNFPLEWRDVEDFLGEFGPFNGRYVPRYPNDWRNRLITHLEEQNIPPLKRSALLERIRREISLCTSPVLWSWDSSKSWGQNITDRLGLNHEAIVVGDAIDPSPYAHWAHAVSDIKQTRTRSWAFHGRVSEYTSLCTPLLVNSPAAYLIDRYLDPFSEAFENLLLAFFDLIKGSKCFQLHLITRQSACGSRVHSDRGTWMKIDEIDKKIREIYGKRLPKDRSMVVHLVREARRGQKGLTMHDRFFMTKYGAINFGQGFFVLEQTQPIQNAFVVEKPHHEYLKALYIDGVARHKEKLPKPSHVVYPEAVETLELVVP